MLVILAMIKTARQKNDGLCESQLTNILARRFTNPMKFYTIVQSIIDVNKS
jgi:hypothetical protein